jgi:hypothetical protein
MDWMWRAGAYSVRTGAWRVYVIGYLASSLLSLLTSLLVIIYSATGLAKDANQPYGVIKVYIYLSQTLLADGQIFCQKLERGSKQCQMPLTLPILAKGPKAGRKNTGAKISLDLYSTFWKVQ